MSWVAKLFLNPDASDLTVVFEGEGCKLRLPAHSYVLKNRSKVFWTLLEEGKHKEDRTGEMLLKGVHVQVALEFLRFLYQDRITDSPVSSLMRLIYAGCIYDVPDLVSYCDSLLESKVTLSNACYIYQELYLMRSGINHPIKSLHKSLNVICAAAEIILSLDMHMIFDDRVLKSFLSNDVLNVKTELTVFHAVWRWGQRQCQVQSMSPTEENTQMFVRDMLSCVRLSPCKLTSESVKNYVSRFNASNSTGKRSKVTINCLSLLKFGVTVTKGDKPLVPSYKLNPRVLPHNTTRRAQKMLFQVSSDRKSYLLGFEVLVYVEGITVQPNDYRSCDWKFRADGKIETFHASTKDVIKIPNGVVFKVVAELTIPLELVPEEFCTIVYCGDRPIYFSSNDILMERKCEGSTTFTIKSLKNLALTLHLYTIQQ